MIPPFFRKLLSYSRDLICRYGNARYCPICLHRSMKFTSYGVLPRSDARCPWCGSLERHRSEWLYLTQKTDLLDGRQKSVLHVAAEPCLEVLLRRHFGATYITADLLDPHAMVRMDIMAIPIPDNRLDVLLCSHVLTTVLDDVKALSEFFRVLKPGRWAVLLENVQENPTYQDPAIVGPDERLRVYGHHDYVRFYGPDFMERVRQAGFIVNKIIPPEIIDPAEFGLYGMTKSVDDLYVCTKPGAADE